MQGGWVDLFVNRILADIVGPRFAPAAFAIICAFLAMLAAMPVLVLVITRYVIRLRKMVASAEEKLDRITARHLEMHNLVKESFALVQERLASTPPPTRFGPTPETAGAPASAAAATAESDGVGTYNYCPGCKEIKFIKFFRCQTCGFHIPKP